MKTLINGTIASNSTIVSEQHELSHDIATRCNRQIFTADTASLSTQAMKRSIDFSVRHTSAHHLKESEAMTFKHT